LIDEYDHAVIGSGIYGMYAAKLMAEAGQKVIILEFEDRPFQRASYINQARVHFGYHYPRSYSTAVKSCGYFERFCEDFGFAINRSFKKIYAISSRYSLTSASQFQKFCHQANIPCEEVEPDRYFNKNTVEAAFETREYAFDAQRISNHLERLLNDTLHVEFMFNTFIERAEKSDDFYKLKLNNGTVLKAHNVLNSTYASINQVNQLFGQEKFRIKYEIAEVILCNVSRNISDVGITVMDGPFFSVMPFGISDTHTLTSVTFTPHVSCYEDLPSFGCQELNKSCTAVHLQNCNTCCARPATAFPYMHQLARKYLAPDIEIAYKSSLFAIKPILRASEIDDSRPTLIRSFSKDPGYAAVLSGKINTVYDMEMIVG
jgi:hypothetical protein